MKYKIRFHCKQPWQTRIECSLQILIPHDRHCSNDFETLSCSAVVCQLAMCNSHLLFCPVSVNLLSTFRAGSSTRSAVLGYIFIFNFTLDANLFKLLRCTCGRAKAFAKFQLNSYEDVLEISESFFKHHTVFTIDSSGIQHILQGCHNSMTRL